MNADIGRYINCISNKIKRNVCKMESIRKINSLSGANGRIIGYIEEHEGPVYQRDIEREFSITRSTASKVISLMEKKGLIERKAEEGDKRLKALVLTDEARMLNKTVRKDIESFEERLSEGFTEEEMKNLEDYLTRIMDNLSKEEK